MINMKDKKLDFRIIKSSSDGRITVIINGTKYLYEIGGHQVPRVLELAKRTPGKALDFLKKAAGKNFSKSEQKIVDKVLGLWGD